MSQYNFVHLHNHTDYSLLDGASKIRDLVKRAVDLQMPAVAITDHGNMFGVIEFYKECVKNNIKPLIGCECYYAPGRRDNKSSDTEKKYYHMTLLAKDETGYKNLLKLVSRGYTEGFYYKPRIDDEIFCEYSKGIIGLSGCLAGEASQSIIKDDLETARQRLGWFSEVLGKDNFFLEIQYHGLPEQKKSNKALIRFSKELDIPLVATNDTHYLLEKEAEYHEVLLAIGSKSTIKDKNRFKFNSSEYYFKTEEEMLKIFSEVPESLANTFRVAEQCSLDVPLPGPILPDYKVPDGETLTSYLIKLANEGLHRNYETVTPEAQKRLDYELDIINKMNFAGYFLIVWDFIRYARENNIWVGPGRGSGAGSLVAYCLGITNIDPLEYNLFFERFLNPKRVTMPDFDIDFCYERRGEVIDYVNQKYGQDRVSQIVTFSPMKAKGVIRDVARALDIPLQRADQIAKMLPNEPKVKLKTELQSNHDLKNVYENGTADEKQLLNVALLLEEKNRHTSVHASGIVIGREEIVNYVPLCFDPGKKITATQFTMTQLEECGLIKMDFLGLKTLTILRKCVEKLAGDNIIVDLEKITLTDQKTFELMQRGHTKGVFQFESEGMQDILRKAKPTCINDLIALNALYRPGPLKFIDSYIKRKHGQEKVEVRVESIRPVLAETYGIPVYQEQVMEIAKVVADYSLAEADKLRRAMAKKKEKEIETHRQLFIKGAVENGINKDTAEKLFSDLDAFAHYGFNKSHSAAYAILAYQTAYLKANYPAYFMSALLSIEEDTDKVGKYLKELIDLDISILPPDVNKSRLDFMVENNQIRYGLQAIKNVGETASRDIINVRDNQGSFKDIYSFLENVDLRVVNKRVFEHLIKSCALDNFGYTRKWLMDNSDRLFEISSKAQEEKKKGQATLFDIYQTDIQSIQRLQPAENPEEWKPEIKLRFEKELLGLYMSGHPLEKYKSFIQKYTNATSRNLPLIPDKKKVQIVAILFNSREKVGRDERKWGILEFEDLYGDFTVYAFQDEYAQIRDELEEFVPYMINGVLTKKYNEPKVIADKIERLDKVESQFYSEVHVSIKDDHILEEQICRLKQDCVENNGQYKLIIHFSNENGDESVIQADPNLRVCDDVSFFKKLESEYNLVTSVWVE